MPTFGIPSLPYGFLAGTSLSTYDTTATLHDFVSTLVTPLVRFITLVLSVTKIIPRQTEG